MTRGGTRPGAGRPRQKTHRVKINLVVDPATVEWIKYQTESRGIPQGRIVDELVRAAHKNDFDFGVGEPWL